MFLIGRLLLLAKGYVRILICGGSYERFLNLCSNHRILLWNLCPAAKGYEANLYLKDFYKLKPLARKCRTRIRIKGKYGLPFFLNRHRKRKVFALGICCCGVFIYFLSCFVWNIQIEGNQSVSRQIMLEYLSENQIGYGTFKSVIDCKDLAARLRSRFSDFTWVSVKIQGTGLLINVQENTDIRLLEDRDYEASDLVSDVNGRIVSMITRSGAPQVLEGAEIAVGDPLVLGRLEITDDAGEVIDYQYCAADADIYVQTTIPYHDEFLMEYEFQSYTGKKRYGGYLELLGNYFGLPVTFHSFEEYDILEKEHRLHILQDFYLPVSFSTVTAREYRTELHTYTKNEAISISEAKLQKFLSQKEEKGVQIFEKNVKIDVSATSCCADGTITVIQKAGRRVDTEKIDLQQE